MKTFRNNTRANQVSILMRLAFWGILFFCAASLIWVSVVPAMKIEAMASVRHDEWSRFWSTGKGNVSVEVTRDLMPAVLPGPLDKWAGAKPHSMDVSFSLPPGDYELRLLFFESHEAAPPLLEIALNGKQLGRFQVPTGRGKPAPYGDPNLSLTVTAPFTCTTKENTLRITSVDGSWAAPARLRITQGIELAPARAGYLLLTRPRLALGLIFALVLAIFLGKAAKEGFRKSTAAATLLVITCLASFVLAEIAFRAYLIHYPQARRLEVQKNYSAKDYKGVKFTFAKMITPNPDNRITYQLKPNLDGYFAGHPLKTNSSHMRGPEVKKEKPKGTFRLLGLGDSVLFGWGVAHENTALEVAGRELSLALSRTVEPLNLACPSYNTAVEVAVYEKVGRRFHPDAVVILLVDNDFDPPSMMFEPVTLLATDKSHLLEQLRRNLALAWRDAGSESERFFTSRERKRMEKSGSELDRRWRENLEAYYQRMAGEEAVAASIRELAALLKTDGGTGVLVYAPNRLGILPDKISQVLEVGRQNGLLVVNMEPVYRAHLAATGGTMVKDIYVHPSDPHPNADGHRLIGQAIAQALSKKETNKP